MTEHFEALEADFLSHYRVDLRHALFGSPLLGARRLLALVRGLPEGTAIQRALQHAEEHKPATTEDIHRFFGENLVVTKEADA